MARLFVGPSVRWPVCSLTPGSHPPTTHTQPPTVGVRRPFVWDRRRQRRRKNSRQTGLPPERPLPRAIHLPEMQATDKPPKWTGAGSNRRHRPFQGRALPAELPVQSDSACVTCIAAGSQKLPIVGGGLNTVNSLHRKDLRWLTSCREGVYDASLLGRPNPSPDHSSTDSLNIDATSISSSDEAAVRSNDAIAGFWRTLQERH